MRTLTGRSFRFLTLSVISVMEVIQGYQRVGASNRIQAFRNAIASEEVLLFDQAAADLAGQIAGDLDRTGQPIGRCDPMIAALAITRGLELVTGNTSHYQAPSPPRLPAHAGQLAGVILAIAGIRRFSESTILCTYQ